MTPALGLDLGGTVRLGDRDSGYTLAPGVVEVVAFLVRYYFGSEVHIISKRPVEAWGPSYRWLYEQEFFARTGVLVGNVRFCIDHSVKMHTVQGLRVTHFVDNRLLVLALFTGVPFRYAYRPLFSEIQMNTELAESRPRWSGIGQKYCR